jgi:ArsR family transcriptional regulator
VFFINIDKTLKALNDSNRRKILMMLRDKSMSAGEIAESFNLKNATVSYHLSLLKDAGLIISKKDKNYIYYKINMSVFEEVVAYILNFTEKGDKE